MTWQEKKEVFQDSWNEHFRCKHQILPVRQIQNNLAARERNADKLGKYEKSDHPQYVCCLTKSSSSEEEEESPGRQNQCSQGHFFESTSQVKSVRRKIRTPPFAQILFLAQELIILILDASSLLKLTVVQQNSHKCKNESDDTMQEISVYMSILGSTLTFLYPPPSLPGNVSRANKCLSLSTGISRRRNQKQSSTVHEDTQLCSQTGKYFENCRDNEKVEPQLSMPETYVEDFRDCSECQEVTPTAGKPKVLQGDGDVDNQEDIKGVWIFFNRNLGREFFNFCSQFCFVFVFVVFCTLRMLIVFSLSCEERTAYTITLSNCIAYLLPNANAFRKTFD